jgi:uncharacterized membrane-anchored protein YjiN (DUF445 family)
MHTMAPYDDPARRVRLARMKRNATGLLGLATVVWAVAASLEGRYPWLGFVRATGEAAMVGGLADWFAVTALFRQPLGLPIPHTGIIPARKDQVGRALGGFVQRNFLSRDVLSARLQSLNAAEHLARWISDRENARRIARQVALGLASAARTLRDEEVQRMIDTTLATRIRRTQVAPLLGKMLSVMTAGGRHQRLLDEMIELAAHVVENHRQTIRDKISAESPWWVPNVVDEKIYEKIITSVEGTLVAVRDDPDHALRAQFDNALREFIEGLHRSPEVIARAEGLKEEILDAEAVRQFSSSLWTDAKAALLRRAEDPDATFEGVERGLVSLGEAVLADPALIAKIDRAILETALHLIERYRHEVEHLIAQTVAAWDPQATSERIELAVGRDLQFIRINGTLVGGLAGLVLFTITWLMK